MNIVNTLLDNRKTYIINTLKIFLLTAFLLIYSCIGLVYADERLLDNHFINADSPLFTPTYDGSNEAVHPSVVFIKDGFNGYKYWMALTPYPGGNDDYENPQILVSNDGVNFTFFNNISSCLAIPHDVSIGGHYSDVNLCYTNNELELYFRYNPNLKGSKGPNNSSNSVYVMKTKDGLRWSDKKLVLSDNTFPLKYSYVSPTIIYEYGTYYIWFSNYSTNLYLTQTKDWIDFDPVITCVLSDKPDNIKIWHHDVIKSSTGYEAVISAYADENSGVQSLYYSQSKDGYNFSNFDIILKPSSKSAFDNVSLYKASLVKLPEKYILYYSARNSDGCWHIGLAKTTE